MSDTLWTPAPVARAWTELGRFWQALEQEAGIDLPDYRALHRWSIDHKEAFWQRIWQHCGIRGTAGETVLTDAPHMQEQRWFPDAALNYADNLLALRNDDIALVEISEDGSRRTLSRHQLYQQAGAVARALLASGVKPGERVAGWLPNRMETLVAALGSAWIGATWSSCSPDFGVQGVLDRFGQIEPAVLLDTDSYHYGGKTLDLCDRIAQVHHALAPRQCIRVPGPANLPVNHTVDWSDWLQPGDAPGFVALPFDHPLFILYSSGTTGAPKCIVHGAGGTLLQHAKEHRLHADLSAGDRLFYYTTCGWMMWNWLIGALHSGASLVLYDGNPGWPHMDRLVDLIDQEQITHFGTSAKFIQALEKAGVMPRNSHDLSSLRCLLSTGSPLLHESYDYLYRDFKADMLVSSISGGTDIISCFALGNPLLPVIRGELQCLGLGMDVGVVDDSGKPVETGKGELVCRQPFPSMPVGFWNDPNGERYRSAYFDRFDGIWAHGDFAELMPHAHHDGLVIHGRSDAVLNPGGVRIGTAEIYRQVETLDAIRESVVVGQDWQGDTRVILFVVLQPGAELDQSLTDRIRAAIRSGASPRHVPAKIVQVAEIPRTVSGKIVELAIRDVIHGRAVRNASALANPQALELFRDLPQLSD